MDFSFDALDQPAEVTIDSTTSSTVQPASTVQVGDGTNVGNSGTITVDSEDQDVMLNKSKVSSPSKETVIDSSTKEKNNDPGSPEKVSTQVPPETTPNCTDVNSSDMSEPLLLPSSVTGTILAPEGASTSFLDKTTNNTDGQDVSTLEPLPDASPNYITITTEFSIVATYNTLENDVLSIQDSI